jgi:hypothetical protein
MLFGKRFRAGQEPEKGKVVAMDRFRNGKSLPAVRQAEAYWTALRTDGEIPFRSQIDPRGIENLLEYAFILERIAPGIARFRLAGQHLSALAGMEVRGMPLTSFFTVEGRQVVSAATEKMFDTPAVVRLDLTSQARIGRSPLKGHLLMMPLRSDLGDVSRALGVLVTGQKAGSGQCRFDISSSEISHVAGPDAKADTDLNVVPGVSDHLAGFAEDQSPLASRGNYLRLVSSRD